jgi:glutamyl-tRNA(Gln) amidotransferase subunit D
MTYSGDILKMLGSAGAKEGSFISLTLDGKEYIGTLMPPSINGDNDVIVIKMKNGYYAGLRLDKKATIKVLEPPVVKNIESKERKLKKGLPNITLIGTGGTIGSKPDAGSLSPGLSAERLLEMMPELSAIATLKANNLLSEFSENIDVKHWQKIADAVADELNGDADAVIISHGTDTIGYTAAALSFMLTELNKPVVLVGSQRSTDRPSSDAYGNVLASVRFCTLSKPGVYVIMHDTMNDDSFAVHRGTRVRKMHTSRRDAFKSVNTTPVAHIDGAGNVTINDEIPKASKKTVAKTKMCNDVILLQFYPGMDPALFKDAVMRSKGVVIAGTGLGHVSNAMITLLKAAIDNGIVVVMASQCINGPINMNIYDTGRELQKIGVISAGDMIPETAYVKLMWSLANAKDTKEAMRKTVAYESDDRRTVDVIW